MYCISYDDDDDANVDDDDDNDDEDIMIMMALLPIYLILNVNLYSIKHYILSNETHSIFEVKFPIFEETLRPNNRY